MVVKSEKMLFYKGMSLLQIIDCLNIPEREINKPLRMSINNFFTSN